VLSDKLALDFAFTYWKYPRRVLLETKNPPICQSRYHSVIQSLFTHGFVLQKLEQISLDEMDLINRVHAYVETETMDKFLEGLEGSIEKGTLTQWAGYIFDHINETPNGIGGHNYREVLHV
jgi:hypothetical protein